MHQTVKCVSCFLTSLYAFVVSSILMILYFIKKIKIGIIKINSGTFSRTASDPQRWKPCGTPLVAVISADGIKRSDIQSTVQKMLLPFLKDKALQQPVPSDMPDQNCDTTSSSRPDTLPELPLHLVDENNACIGLSAGEEAIKFSSSSFMLVTVNWSTELSEKYDIHYLENLPEVCKYGHVSKKTRTEPLSLYACLEAFLREEPLVPEDMW